MALLQALKTETTPQHHALEAQMDITGHFQTRTAYLHLLQRFFTLYEPLEAKLAAAMDWEGQGWDFESRRKTPWLKQDLLALGLSEADIGSLQRCTDLPEISNEAEAIGCLYVLEGSTLGGQVITRLLGQHLDIAVGQGGQFFAGYGPQTVPNWRQFGAWAEAWAARHSAPDILAAAVRSAQETFGSFARWFQT